MKKRVSVVVPIYNEEQGIKQFLSEQLFPELKNLSGSYNFEVILVDDGSEDKTAEIVRAEILREKSMKSRMLCFTRNFGKEVALTAGIMAAKDSDAVIMIDSDGQHPVEAIPKMLERWESGAKVVTAMRSRNKTQHKAGSKIFYKTMRLLGDKNIIEGAMDFRLIDHKVAEDYARFSEHMRITRGLIDWLGYPQEYISVELKGRKYGDGTYSFRKLLKLAGDSFVSMTRTPLAIFGYLGLFITVLSLLLGLFILIQQYILGDPLGLDWSGAVAMCVFISFLVGLVLISQAITALYISQIHIEAKNRPLFVIDDDKSEGAIEKK
ncbi:glycosyltransferase family 2 protein [Candidatus Saccharibacteria bacterium]|nr:glycosyltransferase family 2 protein [Candidatus Saccharibacteria bacterium]